MKTPERISRGSYIRGQFVKAKDPNGEIISRNPADLEAKPLAFPYGFAHVDEAVSAGRGSFSSWKRRTKEERIQTITLYRELLEKRENDLATTISFELGKPLWESLQEVRDTATFIEHLVESLRGTQETVNIDFPDGTFSGVIRTFPRGVYAVLSPAYSPLFVPHTGIVPAVVLGNTVVLKSSKYAPMTGQVIAEIMHDSGVPAGVFNVLHGDSETARRLTSHTDVNGVYFTGSFETASKIKKQVAGEYWKELVLQTGGKNATVVWDDCNYHQALSETFLSAYLTTGQRCHSTSRILVHEKHFGKFLQDFHVLSKRCGVGYGLSGEAVFMGPLFHESSLENYLRYQGIAVREGCEEVMRGKALERDRKGYYVSPSIHVVHQPDPKSVYQKSEILGPNVAFYRVKDLNEVAEIINMTPFGLGATLYSTSNENFYRLWEEVQVGAFNWNVPTTSIDYRLPVCGIKRSGNYRPMGSMAHLQCTYPVATLKSLRSFDPATLPVSFPRLDT